ncbi:MAG: hypothetical protein SPI94_04795 [Candidatus Onthovivens sp.]|nr:hypothetical protein [Clostridium sp.]MDY5984770.1 hypothetical protein [Candidatus Onthovivens sp.]
MIDKIFFGILGVFSSIVSFIIVVLMVGGLLILPMLFKGGWIMYVMIGVCIIAAVIGKDDNNNG